MRDLAGKVAFVTGGASGLGFAMAEQFVAAGMKVAIADVEPKRLVHATHALRELGGSIHAARLDVMDRQAYAAVADEVESALGPVQLLCNNAGVGILGKIADSTFDDWDWILGVNLGGVVNGIGTFLPRMRARKLGGHVLSTASAAGLFASEGVGVYVGAKMAVVGLMEVLRAELAPEHIGVSVLCPHLMRTNIYQHAGMRPERFKASGYAPPTSMAAGQLTEFMKQMNDKGMDPREVAKHAIDGIVEDHLYIIPFPELRTIVRERFEAILAAIPNTTPDPERVKAELATLTFAPYVEARRRG